MKAGGTFRTEAWPEILRSAQYQWVTCHSSSCWRAASCSLSFLTSLLLSCICSTFLWRYLYTDITDWDTSLCWSLNHSYTFLFNHLSSGFLYLTGPYEWLVGTPVFCGSSQDDRVECWIQTSTVQRSTLAVISWTISAKISKHTVAVWASSNMENH